MHGTTILTVRRDGRVAMAGDGQVTLGSTVVKHGARKIRRLHHGEVLAGFAGSTADAMSLISKFESKLEEHRGNLERSAVGLHRRGPASGGDTTAACGLAIPRGGSTSLYRARTAA